MVLLSLLSSADNGGSDQGQCCCESRTILKNIVLPFSFFFLHNVHLDFLANLSCEEIPSSQNGILCSAVVDTLRE